MDPGCTRENFGYSELISKCKCKNLNIIYILFNPNSTFFCITKTSVNSELNLKKCVSFCYLFLASNIPTSPSYLPPPATEPTVIDSPLASVASSTRT